MGVSDVQLWRSELLRAVPHGFAGRKGGNSTGLYASLNCGPHVGDHPWTVDLNRATAMDAVMPSAALVGVRQVHGRDCATVAIGRAGHRTLEGDALVTDQPGALLAILTADCAPVLLADVEAGVVGAAHAGWRGALAGVTDATVEAMGMLGAQAERIVAAVGPCIARASYEVDAAMLGAFVADDRENERFFTDGRPGRWQFDLEAYVAHRLARAGVRRVELMGLDTYAREGDFFSHRRATHRGEAQCGRQVAMIGVESR